MKLSAEQANICKTKVDEDILVVAAPGSGKTTSIISRMERLYKKGNISQQKMVYITYSKKLADEVEAKLNDAGLSQLYHAGTIDSLCWKLLATAQKPPADDTGSSTWSLAPADILDTFLSSCSANTDPAEFLAPIKHISHAFLDEAQDLDKTRFDAIAVMLPQACMMIVGDPRQCIYQNLFGADPTLMQRLRPSAKVMTLSTSFRLTPSICAFNNAAFQYAAQPKIIPGNHVSKDLLPMHTLLHASNCGEDKTINRPRVVEHVVNRCRLLVGSSVNGRRIGAGDIAILSPTARSKSSSSFLLNSLRTMLEHAGFPAFLNQREFDTPSSSSKTAKDRIYLGTCHSFKGAERDHVILLNFFVGPGAFMRDFDGHVNMDYKNLLFVACTRARESLELIESCYYACKNERIEYLRNAEAFTSQNIISAQTLGRLPTNTPFRCLAAGVTEVLQALTASQYKCLKGLVVTDAEEVTPISSLAAACARGSSKSRPAHPPVFTENADTAIYGKFLEMVIARRLSETSFCFNEVSTAMVSMPLYITDRELKDVQTGRDSIDPFKFDFCQITLEGLRSVIKDHSAKKTRKVDLEAALKSRGCFVLRASDMFYDRLSQLAYAIRDVKDRSLPTHQTISALWEVTLLKQFHETSLGVYWLKPWRQSSAQLLPRGLPALYSTWPAYLDAIAATFQAAGLPLTAYQHHLASGRLVGYADLICGTDAIVDVKCSMDEMQVTSSMNCAQVQAYRAMFSEAAPDKRQAYLFSAMTCSMYRVPCQDGGDEKVLQFLKDIEKQSI